MTPSGPVARRWHSPDHLCIVAAPGPSLTAEVAEACRGHDAIAVQDAYRRLPFAQVLYGCDAKWWRFHKGAQSFAGEKWTSHGPASSNDKSPILETFGLKSVAGFQGEQFSTNPDHIYYGSNSGFQAVGLAILFGARRIVMVGFDMRHHKGKHHFFGNHPAPLHNPTNYQRFIGAFEKASKRMPEGVTILNATPGSALKCFPMVTLDEALGCLVN
jgi:hypothetical protein